MRSTRHGSVCTQSVGPRDSSKPLVGGAALVQLSRYARCAGARCRPRTVSGASDGLCAASDMLSRLPARRRLPVTVERPFPGHAPTVKRDGLGSVHRRTRPRAGAPRHPRVCSSARCPPGGVGSRHGHTHPRWARVGGEMDERGILDATPTQLLIGGGWRDGSAGRLPVEDPSTGEVLCEVADASADDAKAALDAAAAAQDAWAVHPAAGARGDPAPGLRGDDRPAGRTRVADDAGDGQEPRGVPSRDHLRGGVPPLVLRGGRAESPAAGRTSRAERAGCSP